MKHTLRFITVLLLAPLAAFASDTMPAPANVTTSIRYTLKAPASADWTAKDFDDSTWTKTEDAAIIPAAVPKPGRQSKCRPRRL